MPWPVYLALKQLFPTGRVSFFTILSVVGVMLGVTLLIVSRSIMGGFGHQVRQMIIDTQGEVQIVARQPMGDAAQAATEKALREIPAVAAFAPRAAGVVMLQFENRPAFPLIQGFEFERMKQVIPLERYLVAGTLGDVDDDSVILSSILARSLGANVGDVVSVFSPLMLERMKHEEVLLPREVRVAAIFQIGHQQLDSSTVLCSLRLMQDLYGLGSSVHGYNVRLQAGASEYSAVSALNRILPPDVQAMTWFQSNADFQAILSFEKNMFTFVVSFIVLVAAFAITMSLLSTVVRKTREIGLLVAMGGREHGVVAMFCLQGLLVGVFGSLLGAGLAAVVLAQRDGIVRVLSRLTMGKEDFQQFYLFSHLPAHTSAAEVVVILLCAIAAATIAGLIPAWRASRLKPVDALRSE
jgi:lipoprotein-releasing system permease protein